MTRSPNLGLPGVALTRRRRRGGDGVSVGPGVTETVYLHYLEDPNDNANYPNVATNNRGGAVSDSTRKLFGLNTSRFTNDLYCDIGQKESDWNLFRSNGATQQCLEFWCMIDPSYSSTGTILSGYKYSNSGRYWELEMTGGNEFLFSIYTFRGSNSSRKSLWSTPTGAYQGNWVHVCFQRDGDRGAMFANGVVGSDVTTSHRADDVGNNNPIGLGATLNDRDEPTANFAQLRYSEGALYPWEGFAPPEAPFPVPA